MANVPAFLKTVYDVQFPETRVNRIAYNSIKVIFKPNNSIPGPLRLDLHLGTAYDLLILKNSIEMNLP